MNTTTTHPAFRNYVPHSKWGAVRKFETEDDYLLKLSQVVSAACNRFFRKRGIEISHQFSNSVMFNNSQKKD